ncbi:DNA gyrase subunit A [Candidatus Nesciobacter abundans]|uniref:DNA topoisomerase (ATP-hydrolyzing) n=1 Tax=Candidatus Nesciobacter abundans TaxID=2601668 RepID=A0A5C0UGB6_9PROT|nr:DNA gyrase subunit A [Candidatus Nesciobacter abundans]QEK39108.1 DNA gyrase subunit A [Candidatus Nesciobacter abundans]
MNIKDLSDTPSEEQKISKPFKFFEKELQASYLDYSMSVIISRAVPDAYDGLKPVQRRILYSMIEENCVYENPHRKSARIVGDVLGKYHPHGEAAIYDAMTRMGQNFSMYAPLIDGQGNFGSIDGDKPASMRYTEARLSKVSNYLLEDYEKDTVDMSLNYDGTLKMPNVLPARFPNLLVNGANGIAVGMATFIPPHNLSEVIDATCALIENRDLDSLSLMEYLPAPDFPLGGIIFRSKGLKDVYEKGKGSFVVRGLITQENVNGRDALVIKSIPYQINKEILMDKISELMQTETLSSIHTFRDESNRDGMRVVLELKKDSNSDLVMNRVYKFTQMQSSMHVNMLALNKNRPQRLGLKEVLDIFLNSREKVLIRRTNFFLRNARSKSHILWGLALALRKLDEVIACIKSSSNTSEAQEKLQSIKWKWNDIEIYLKILGDTNVYETYTFSEEQAKAILNLKLQKLTGLERDKLEEQIKILGDNIKQYIEILNNSEKRFEIIKNELIEIKEKFGNKRRSAIESSLGEDSDEDYIESEDMVVSISKKGYVKRIPLSSYRLQKRGGKGKQGMDISDPIENIFTANTHQEIVFFSNTGYAYPIKTYRLPLISSGQGRGKSIVNIFPLSENEKITGSVVFPLTREDSLRLMFITSKGYVRKNNLSDFEKIRSNGKIAIKLDEGEDLLKVLVCQDIDDILLVSSLGKITRFSVSDIRVFQSRSSRGVRGMNLSDTEKNKIVSADLIGESKDSLILTISEKGYGKRSSKSNYKISGRGAKGVSALNVTEKTGKVVGAYEVSDETEIIMMTKQGQVIRFNVENIRVSGRKTQGVILTKLQESDAISDVVVVKDIKDEEISE